VPDGPVRVFFDRLHELHHRAGWPSLREMAKEVGCSHTTISVAFAGPAVPRWGLVELIVETLNGDTTAFHDLWLAASGGPAPTPAPTPPKPSIPVPRQLPADVAGFIGRTHQLADLDRLLGTDPANAMVISAISGTAGVGKTALAVHWAHRAAARFPDGQLYLNLRGYDPDRPMLAAEALEALLRALDADAAIPQSMDERAARYRTLLAGRKMLVLLDNVHSVDQIRDLLPGTPSCLVLVTSRDTLPALVARHGAVRINLDLLSETESVELLGTLIGSRVDSQPEQAVALARRCARLPLALRIAAELAATRPSATLAGLVAELGDESRRLDLLAAGEDDYTAVRAVFSWSCRHLSPEAVAAFQLIGLHPGQDTDVPAIAALTGGDLPGTHRQLDVLVRAHLVEERGSSRFGMHDLLRAYAAEQAGDQRAAQLRLYDHYLRTATAAVELAFPRGAGDAGQSGSLADAREAQAWLAIERANLLAVVDQASRVSPAHVLRFSETLAPYLDASGYYRDGLALHQLALAAAGSSAERGAVHNRLGSVHLRMGRYPAGLEHFRQALADHREHGDLAGQDVALYGLGSISWRLGRYADALEHIEACLAIRRELGDRQGEGTCLYAIGTVIHQLGRYPEALDHQCRALAIHRELGNRLEESRALNNMSVTLERMGRLPEAFDRAIRALVVSEAIGNRLGMGVAMTNLGTVLTKLGRFDDSLSLHHKASAVYRELSYPIGEADALHGLGELYRRMHRLDEAIDHLRRAIAIGREIGLADVQRSTLIDLGNALAATGQAGEAERAYRSAFALAEENGDRYEQARALAGLADLAPDPAEAKRHRDRAFGLFTGLGVPEAETLRGQLRQVSSTAS
jgi:tetratricopeptide (TPR) repeat protein